MFRSRIVAVALLLGPPGWGCNTSNVQPDVDGGTGDPDGGGGDGGGTDASPGDDGGGQAAGLGLAFGSIPSLPGGAIPGDFPATLDEARIDLQNLRALGDSAPGDSRTSVPSKELRWGMSGGGGDDGGGDDGGGDDLLPEEDDDSVFFPTAPPGKYSDVKASIVHYRMVGTVDVGAGPVPFQIEDTPPTPRDITVSLGQFQLDANTTRTITIKAGLSRAISEPRWDQVPLVGGERRLDASTPEQLEAVREALDQAFTLDASGG